MSRTAQISGNIAVQQVGSSPVVAVPFTAESADVTQQTAGRKRQAASTTAALSMGAVTLASFVSITGKSAASGNAAEFQVNLNAVGVLPACTEFVHNAKTSPAITSIAITTPAGDAVDLDFVIAGT